MQTYAEYMQIYLNKCKHMHKYTKYMCKYIQIYICMAKGTTFLAHTQIKPVVDTTENYLQNMHFQKKAHSIRFYHTIIKVSSVFGPRAYQEG